MSQYSRRYNHFRQEDYYSRRPRSTSKIMGVCSGVARQFDWDVTLVRVVAVLCLFTFTAPTFLAYIVAGALFY